MEAVRNNWVTLLLFAGLVIFLGHFAMAQSDNPFAASSTDFQRWGPRIPDDAIMPSPDMIKQVENWSRAAFSGKAYHLDDAALFSMSPAIPFSFQYGGVDSSELLPHWTFEEKSIDKLNTAYSWTDPKTGLKVSAHVRRFERFAGVDWVLYFENTGEKETPLVENVRTLDLDVKMRGGDNPTSVIHTLHGDNHGPTGWTPAQYPLANGENRRFTPVGGKSSNGAFPFWNIQGNTANDGEESTGLFVAVGWSGQWTTDFSRKGDDAIHLSAGMEKIATILYPGESIRQPRVLVMPWNSNRTDAQVLFRRLLMFEYTPKPNHNLPVQMPIAGQCFDRYWFDSALQWSGHEWGTYQGQVAWAKILHEAGFTHHWLDAAWFQDGWWIGAGNWSPDTTRFPQGIEPLGKVIHDFGMKFILWIEPERSLLESSFYKEHPEYFFPSLGHKFFSKEQTLFKLSDPEARKHLTEFLYDWIVRNGVDVLRIDFNINPLSYWIANDTEDRHGMTEIRYVAGHYEMWNQLIESIPGLWIDNCASGGRRIDLETTAISVPLWSSDAGCSPLTPVEWQQTATMGMAQYLPLFSCAVWESDPYSFRSCANMGMVASFNFMDSDYDPERAKAACREARVYQKFWYGDFYPLSEIKPGKNNLVAWQLHREDLDAGIIYVFRQEECPYIGYELSLYAIDTNAMYEVTLKRDYSEGTPEKISGKQLIGFPSEIPQKRSSLVIEYRKITNN